MMMLRDAAAQLCVKGIRKAARPATANIEDVLGESMVEWKSELERWDESVYEEQWNSTLKDELRKAV